MSDFTERARRIFLSMCDTDNEGAIAMIAALLAREAAMEFALLKAKIGMCGAARLLHETHTPCIELAHGLAAVAPFLVAPTPTPSQPGEAPADRREQSLAMMLRMCASALKRRDRADLADKAMSLLRSYGLQGSPLRDDGEAPAPKPPAEREAPASREAREAPTCVECGGPLQWRCPACKIAQSREVAREAPEPVAWLVRAKNGMVRACWTSAPSADQIDASLFDGDTITPLYTAAALSAARQEGRESGRREMRKAWEIALRKTWPMVDPLRPPGAPGSYARGCFNGTADALATLRENADAAIRALPRQRAGRDG